MKANNQNSITIAYFKFSIGLLALVAIAIIALVCFIDTARSELAKIEVKTDEYDKIHTTQLSIVNSVDSLCHYISLLNTSDKINDVALQNLISNRKMSLLNTISTIPEKDGVLYSRLANQINSFLGAKDSIRILTVQQQLVKTDLLRCVDDNKKATRKLSIGSISIEAKNTTKP